MHSPDRRTLLAAIAAGPLLAGCVEGPDSGNGDGESSGQQGGENGNGDDEPPHSRLPDESFPDECPAYDNVDRVICADGIGTEDVLGYLDASRSAISHGESVDFTLYNDSDETLQSNFYDWRVDKRVDGEWYHVAPMGHNDPLMGVKPGESHTWTLTIDNSGIEDGAPVSRSGGTSELTISGLGGGHFAFRGRGWFESVDEAIAFATTFEFDGSPISLTPTETVEETTWEGETLVATSTRGDPDSDRTRLGAFELEAVDDPDEEATSMIVEQILRRPRLRDVLALAFEYDAEYVRLEEFDGAIPIFGSRIDGILEFQGTNWKVSTRKLEE